MSSLSLTPDPSTFFSRCTKEPSPRCALSTSVAVAGSRRRSFVALSISTMVSLHMDYDNTRSSSRSQAMELSRVLDQSLSSSKIESGDISVSRSLPKPLTASDLVEVTSTGPRFRVAYQGLPGAYSESAAAKAYPKCEAVPCEQFETTFEAVERWQVDRAVLPIENSLGGSIHRNYDLLIRHKLHIVGEVRFAVRHCLLANRGVKKENLRRVLSHPQALAQCEHTLTKLAVVKEAVDDTAGAAQFVSINQFRDTAAVASSLASKIYGLDILVHDIQDDSDNITRFLMLAREPIIPKVDRPFKTSVVFSLEEGPGVLFKALAVFAMRNINLTKVLPLYFLRGL
ncbi:Prephenate dehydratase [Zostera marina]|uniref:arogenate dehydratase n=1 Tax=Zostera marina TaxID=29655 RepID=A0A0K9NLA9_ZOSMR|nr:Prephenate dehydratase [Zostera marina]